MNYKIWTWMIIAGLALSPTVGLAQRDREANSDRSARRGNRSGKVQGTLDYQDPSKRKSQSNMREDREKKEAEAKKKADEAKKKDERRKHYEDEKKRRDEARNGKDKASKDNKGTSDSKSADAKKRKGAKSPDSAGGSSDPTLSDVTEVMLNAVKTRTVHFDPDKAKNDPGIILLNQPKFNTKDRVRAGDFGVGEEL